jgi:murein DD-endopeptidase MepM/ murein hydrolase activator NlpD
MASGAAALLRAAAAVAEPWPAGLPGAPEPAAPMGSRSGDPIGEIVSRARLGASQAVDDERERPGLLMLSFRTGPQSLESLFWQEGPARPAAAPGRGAALAAAWANRARASKLSGVEARRRPQRNGPGELEVDAQYVEPPTRSRGRIDEDRLALSRVFQDTAGKDLLVRRSFVWPRPRKIRAPFGQSRRFNGKVKSVHQGIDLDGDTGDVVKAANDGEVVLARNLFMSGKTIYIDHGGGILTGYYHLSELDALEGETVKRGAAIGKVGETGRTTGPHLHFAVRAGGKFVDPDWFIRQPISRARSYARPSRGSAPTASLARGRRAPAGK